MASFKEHCAFGFWKARLMSDPYKLLDLLRSTSMEHLGKIKSLSDLPSDNILNQYIKEAMRLNEEEVKSPSKTTSKKKELVIPDYFLAALKKNKKASKTFESFSYTNKNDYIEWLTDAKTEETRNKRLATAIEWLSEGKIRNWKYAKK